MRFLTQVSKAFFVGLFLNLAAGTSPMAVKALAQQENAKPLLIITGTIDGLNGQKDVRLSRADLEALGLETLETSTPWYPGKEKFEGVSMKKLLAHVGAKGTSLVAIALDDYVSTIPIEDFNKYPVILAMKRNGKDMPVSDKGPLFIIYPFDAYPELKAQVYYSRSAWQVARFQVK